MCSREGEAITYMQNERLRSFKREPMNVFAAQQAVMKRITANATEQVELSTAHKRYSAKTYKATMSVPHFERSVMDGYAVRAADISQATSDHPVELQVVAHVACGEIYDSSLQKGQAVRIMTGGQVPAGADAVIKLESTSGMGLSGEALLEQRYVQIQGAVSIGENITPIGSELEQGDILVKQGQRLGPGELALLAMFGYAHAEVYTRPKVAIIATGKELLQPGTALEPGKIWNSNSYMLMAQIEETGGIPDLLPLVGDHVDHLTKQIHDAIHGEYDAVITIGGVSVGDHDILYEYTQQWKGELLFNKLSMRPGSPTTVGFLEGKPLFALSGNPSACYVGSEMFVRPALLRMQGSADPYRASIRARLVDDYRVEDTFVRFVRGIMHTDEAGSLWVQPTTVDRSNATISIRDANCLFIVPPSHNGLDRHTLVDVIPLHM